MDSAQAKLLSDSLLGAVLGEWRIEDRIDHGKSAIVMKASRGQELAAIKVFHPELIERFGRDVQLERISRECTLVGAHHPNLVRILGGGECDSTKHLYVVMEYLPWANLRGRLAQVPTTQIKPIVSQLASAAMFLEERGLVHRDIKPENIAVSEDMQTIKLLDLGVLRPFGASDLTDADQRPFIGTLRYSSPEFLRRQEEPTIDGWRAVTIYQIGAVLHDLLTREPLFNEFSEPYSLLVEAVLNKIPSIWGDEPSLISLCKHCLHKNPVTRTELVKWTDFTFHAQSLSVVSDAMARIKSRQHYALNSGGVTPTSHAEILRFRKMRLDSFCNRVESRLAILINSLQCFPPKAMVSDRDVENSTFTVHLQFERSLDLGLNAYLLIHLRLQVLDPTEAELIYQASSAAELSPTEMTSSQTNFVKLTSGTEDEILSGAELEACLVKALDSAYLALDAHSKDGLQTAYSLNIH